MAKEAEKMRQIGGLAAPAVAWWGRVIHCLDKVNAPSIRPVERPGSCLQSQTEWRSRTAP